ncbi:isochorismatase family cysteine hydrolase [Porcipelethomonas sp.]|uniref:isochorismatase family cysteine hydrolase n=1 Tax=Porcipelethomonas sp. TaxID=2981675 RepID=UPI003EF9F06A
MIFSSDDNLNQKHSDIICGSVAGFAELAKIPADKLNCNNTVFVMVDIINGFIRTGALHDKKIESIIPPVCNFLNYCNRNKITSIAFADSHSENSCEFSSFPEHCLTGSEESQIVKELTKIGGFQVIEKNSTNGFHAPGFKEFLKENPDKSSYIVCGDCTDICVLNFCLCLKTYFNEINKESEIIVPLNMTETYHSTTHDKNYMNIASLEIMNINGIKLTGGIEINE